MRASGRNVRRSAAAGSSRRGKTADRYAVLRLIAIGKVRSVVGDVTL